MKIYLEIDIKDQAKYLGYRLSLIAYLQIYNMVLDDDLGLNLYIVPTVYYVVIISDDKILEKSERRSQLILVRVLAKEVKDGSQSELSQFPD